MNRSLDALAPVFRPLVYELIARCVEAGVMIVITNTLRTEQEQIDAVRTGHSKVAHSKHEDGLAVDICLVSEYMIHGSNKLQWETSDPDWKVLGAIGLKVGLRWGGTFMPLDKNGVGWDPGHFEYKGSIAPVINV